jgi:hypothetical protein
MDLRDLEQPASGAKIEKRPKKIEEKMKRSSRPDQTGSAKKSGFPELDTHRVSFLRPKPTKTTDLSANSLRLRYIRITPLECGMPL